ncbi:MAG: DedA family protein [Kiritimatiellae bacterium]|nr:DedA family protein [Kiritimatiellia bacterium]
MTEIIAENIAAVAAHAPVWGFVIIFLLMAIESSFIPFPSEVVMIPAGFLAYRGELTTGQPILDLILALLVGTAGSIVGAYVNYYLGLKLGRPFLHKYGKYFFLKEEALDRAEEVFREHGDITTFVCRLIPAIRQLISIPAGLAKMNFKRFTFFTTLGAGIWGLILLLIGYSFGMATGDMTYPEMVTKGKDLIHDNYIWILLALVLLVVGYIAIHKKVMGHGKKPQSTDNN